MVWCFALDALRERTASNRRRLRLRTRARKRQLGCSKQKKQRQQEEEEKTHRETERRNIWERKKKRDFESAILSILLRGEREKEKHLRRSGGGKGGGYLLCLRGREKKSRHGGEDGDTNREKRIQGIFFFSSRRVFLVVSSKCPSQSTMKLFLRKLYVEEQATRIPKIRSRIIRRSRSQATMMGAMAQTGSDRLPPDHHLNPGRFLEVLDSWTTPPLPPPGLTLGFWTLVVWYIHQLCQKS